MKQKKHIKIDMKLYRYLKAQKIIPDEPFYKVIWRLISSGTDGGKARARKTPGEFPLLKTGQKKGGKA